MRAATLATSAAVLAARSLAPSCAGEGFPAPPRAERSDLVLVVDSLRADHMGVYGDDHAVDPALEQQLLEIRYVDF